MYYALTSLLCTVNNESVLYILMCVYKIKLLWKNEQNPHQSISKQVCFVDVQNAVGTTPEII